MGRVDIAKLLLNYGASEKLDKARALATKQGHLGMVDMLDREIEKQSLIEHNSSPFAHLSPSSAILPTSLNQTMASAGPSTPYFTEPSPWNNWDELMAVDNLDQYFNQTGSINVPTQTDLEQIMDITELF